MTLRQKLLKIVYPLLRKLAKTQPGVSIKTNSKNSSPRQPFGSLPIVLNDGQMLDVNVYKGKKLLLVNTASDCGYTAQYAELQKLYEQYHPQLQIIAFPANDFKKQEKGSDEEIAAFCQVNYGITFPVAKKSSVLKSPQQNPVFAWLADPLKNGWNDQPPQWNFSKYLLNEAGLLTHYFAPAVSPLEDVVINAIRQ